MTLSVMTHSTMTFSITKLSVKVFNAILLSVDKPSAAFYIVILSVKKLNVILLNAVAPSEAAS